MSSSPKSDHQPRISDHGRPDPDDVDFLTDHLFQLVAMDPDNLRAWQQLQTDRSLKAEGPLDERSRDLGQQRADLLKGHQATTDVPKKDAPGER